MRARGVAAPRILSGVRSRSASFISQVPNRMLLSKALLRLFGIAQCRRCWSRRRTINRILQFAWEGSLGASNSVRPSFFPGRTFDEAKRIAAKHK